MVLVRVQCHKLPACNVQQLCGKNRETVQCMQWYMMFCRNRFKVAIVTGSVQFYLLRKCLSVFV